MTGALTEMVLLGNGQQLLTPESHEALGALDALPTGTKVRMGQPIGRLTAGAARR